MRVPYVDLPAQSVEVHGALHRAFDRVLRRGDFVLGEAVEAFEAAFARSCQAPYAVGVNSGTDALWLSLAALGIGPGDEVITTAYTFFATASAIALTGASPVAADIDPVTYTLDPASVEAAVTKRTKAILAVHLFGQPADMDRLTRIARRHRLALVEDCAQAHGAAFRGQSVGTFGEAGAFSFYPTKNLSALGDAGLIVTTRRALRDRLRLLRDHGQTRPYRHAALGHNSRLDTLQAAVLLAKLPRLAAWNRRRAQHARRYTARLGACAARIVLPHAAPHRTHVYHVYAVQVPGRDRVVRGLRARGIQALVHYPSLFYEQPVFRRLGCRRGRCPVAERLARRAVSLPIAPQLQPAQIDYVAEQLINIVGGR